MNKTQLEYATRRLDAAAAEKLQVIRNANTTKGKPFDGAALVAAIKKGVVTVKTDSAGHSIHHYTDISDVFDGWKGLGVEDKLDEAAYQKAAAPINAEVTRIRDQLFLGDAKEALALIEAFVSKKF